MATQTKRTKYLFSGDLASTPSSVEEFTEFAAKVCQRLSAKDHEQFWYLIRLARAQGYEQGLKEA